MRTRAVLVAAGLVAATGLAVTAPSAAAVCDPDFEPLCLSPCITGLLDATGVEDLVDRLGAPCPR